MNTLVSISAILVIVLSAFYVLVYPFLIGKPKEGNYDGESYLMGLFQVFVMDVVAGRVLGWW